MGIDLVVLIVLCSNQTAVSTWPRDVQGIQEAMGKGLGIKLNLTHLSVWFCKFVHSDNSVTH